MDFFRAIGLILRSVSSLIFMFKKPLEETEIHYRGGGTHVYEIFMSVPQRAHIQLHRDTQTKGNSRSFAFLVGGISNEKHKVTNKKEGQR